MGVNFSLHNNFANSGSFAKVSIPVHIYNSLLYETITERSFIDTVEAVWSKSKPTVNQHDEVTPITSL